MTPSEPVAGAGREARAPSASDASGWRLQQAISALHSGIRSLREQDADLAVDIIEALPDPLLEFVNRAMRRVGLTDYYYSVDRDRMRYTCLLDTTRAREILGYQPTRTIEFAEYRGLEG